jgi:hypothetical protein
MVEEMLKGFLASVETMVERLSFFRQLPTHNMPAIARVDRSEGLIAARAPGSQERD